MKFGFYSPYLDTFGGGERYMLTLASHLSQKYQTDIFWDDSSVKAPISRFLKIDLQKAHFVKNIFKNDLSAKSVATIKYSCLFILSDGSIPFTLARKNILHFQVPFRFPPPDLKTRIKLSRFQSIVTNSNFTKCYIDKSFNVESQVIYPPVDIDAIKVSKKENIILSVGKFTQNPLHVKKQEVLIEVFKEVYKKAPTWRLVLIGQAKKQDEKYLRQLKKSAQGYAIKILPNCPIETLRDIYSKASIYWHATGYGEDENKNPEKMEHFGISTVEAQAAGAVPVVIDKGGLKEIVTDKKNGRLWITKAQLFERTLELINSPDIMIKLSEAAIKNSKRFSIQKFLDHYEKIMF